MFNGAMDNASGIAVLMQIARDLAKKKAPRRSIVFAAVTAEELGLLGSRAYVAEAQARGQQIVANLNTDMFMPLYPMKQVVVFGLEESDLADDARCDCGGAWHRGADGSAAAAQSLHPQRSIQLHSCRHPRARHQDRRTSADSPEAEIDSKWFAERYHAVSDSADQPVDLAAVGKYQEFAKRLAVRVANRKVAPRWYDTSVFSRLEDPTSRVSAGTGFSPSRIRDPRRPASRRSRRPGPVDA